MKRLLVVVAVLALAAFAVWIVATGQDARPSGAPIPVDDGEGTQLAPGSHQMTVDDIIDGDTLTLSSHTVTNGFPPEPQLRVRLIGIDTPEVYPEYECYGDEAEAELARLAPIGSSVYVMPDADPQDDYGRWLLYLWTEDGTFINLALVEGGFAEAIRVGANDAWYDDLRAAENAASTAGLGMWSC